MTITQIPGAVRLRRHQYGVQSALNTAVAATRRVPWRGPIVVNPNWTDPDTDFGSIDPIAQPYSAGLEVSCNATAPVLYYNDLPLRNGAGLLGGVTPTGAGTAKTWLHTIASLTTDVFDIFTDQYNDDTEATDTIVGVGGLIDSLEESFGPDLGPFAISDNWIYSTATLGQNGTDGLTVDQNGIIVMADETEVKMDTTAAAIGTTKLTDTIHGVRLSIQNNLDKKKFANGSNSVNQLGGYGRGARVIELELTVAKTAAMITEAATLLTRPRPSRFFEIFSASTSLAEAGIPYSYRRRGAFRLFERSDTEINGNAAIVLLYRAYYDSTLTYAYQSRIINTQTTVVAP